ncbi:MAG: NAD(P)/FAD-dependent oxidoreductase [Actinomycetota bacterium]|nr:NAD(P)/FAD-dependent oxidoreductase [Actinomycetota bacterium]
MTERERALPEHVDVAVIGAGFGGIGAAIGLLRAGRRDLVVFERADRVGGVWRDNSYPGCACDVPSHLYSFSFAPNPGWQRTFSPQGEIEGYLQRTARDFGVLPYLHCSTELLSATWSADDCCWLLTTSRGSLTARVLVVGSGGLSEPALPDLPGLASFEGMTMHSAGWDHAHSFDGERVAVIGTGASAVQFVPEVVKQAGHVTVFQRTAPWVLPRKDRAIHPVERLAFRWLPGLQRAIRTFIYWLRESWVLGFANPRLMARPEKLALSFLASQVADPTLRAKLTPSYRLGCKRVLLSNTWYPALTQPHVEVETCPVERVLPGAVVTRSASGEVREHPVDTIIFGTGFRVTDPPVAERIVGPDGTRLADLWAQTGMQALHGTTVAGFPNLFFLAGPNTGLGHSSIILIIESHVRYLVAALRAMDRAGVRAVAPRPEVQERHNEDLQRRLASTVWNTGGCASWYLDPRTGGNTTLWPTFTFVFRRQLRAFDLAEYEVTTGVVEVAA